MYIISVHTQRVLLSDNVHPDASFPNLGITQDCPSPTLSLGTVLWVGAWGQNTAQAVSCFMFWLREYAIKNWNINANKAVWGTCYTASQWWTIMGHAFRTKLDLLKCLTSCRSNFCTRWHKQWEFLKWCVFTWHIEVFKVFYVVFHFKIGLFISPLSLSIIKSNNCYNSFFK